MKRADKRTPRDVAIQRLTNLMDLPDRDLCQRDHKTAKLPHTGPCAFYNIDSNDQWVPCDAVGEFATHTTGTSARRGCVKHVAVAVRARLWLQRRHLQLDLNGDT